MKLKQKINIIKNFCINAGVLRFIAEFEDEIGELIDESQVFPVVDETLEVYACMMGFTQDWAYGNSINTCVAKYVMQNVLNFIND